MRGESSGPPTGRMSKQPAKSHLESQEGVEIIAMWEFRCQ